MSHCPSDGKPCCDDLCHAGGCMKTGVSMLRACPECKNLVNDDELICACDDDEYPEYDSDGEQ